MIFVGVKRARVEREGRVLGALHYARAYVYGEWVLKSYRRCHVKRTNDRFIRLACEDDTRADIGTKRGVRGGVLPIRFLRER